MPYSNLRRGFFDIAFMRPLDDRRFNQLKGYLANNYTLLRFKNTEDGAKFRVQLQEKHINYINKRKVVGANLCTTESLAFDFMVNLTQEMVEALRGELSLIFKYMNIRNSDYTIKIY